MMTRKQRLADECSHREYYSQFVTDGIRSTVARYIGTDRIKRSDDPHLNDIPLKEWNNLPMLTSSVHSAFRAAGDYVTLAGQVCIYKEAARQLAEG